MSKQKIENPKLTAKNPHYGSRYAPLDEVLRVILDVIPSERIHQSVDPVDGVAYFITRFTDEKGVTIKQSSFPFAPGKGDPQSLGSALTYARRYGLLLLFNLVGEEDDDAEAAHGRGKTSKPKASKPKATKSAAPLNTEATKAPKATLHTAATLTDNDDW